MTSTQDDLNAVAELFPQQAEILLEKSFNGKQQPDFNDFDAVLNCVSRMDTVKRLQYRDYNYMINTNEPIQVTRDIYFELRPQVQVDSKTETVNKIVYRLYSDTLGIRDIKDYIARCRQEYESQRNNKLGNETFFFDQITANDNKFNQALSFDKKNFTTYRTFDNVFFEEKAEVEGRLRHYMENKGWYAKRGIPHTLGYLFHGKPGTGKTSCIKAIANITKRHIINVRLSEVRTNTQLKNLFYNPVLQVVNPETLCVEKFIVPIHQRLYVIEDIDCMTDLVKRRDLQYKDEDDEPDVKAMPKALLQKKPASKTPAKKTAAPEFLDGDEELQAYYEETLGDEKRDMTREIREEEAKDRITLDSLLNILDGTLEIPNRMFCITTNHLEVLDTALIRPGRVDMIIEFKHCTRAIVRQMFDSFYEQQFDEARFAKIKDYKISPAVVNQVLFKHFTHPDAAIEELVGMGNKRKTYKKRDKDASEE